MTTEVLQIKKIRTDMGTQLRVYVPEATVKDYSEKMAAGEKFPPVDVFWDGKSNILADGFSRLAAKVKLGLTEIEAKVHQGTFLDALIFAAGANAKHGLQRTVEDKRKTVRTLLEKPEIADKSDRAIAAIANVSDPFVGSIRLLMEKEKGGAKPRGRKTRTGKDGKRRVVKQPREPGSDNKGMDHSRTGRQGEAQFDLREFKTSVGGVARHLDQLARDFGQVHPRTGTIKETLEHKGLRRQLEEITENTVSWRKQLEKEKKDAAKQA